MTARLLRPLANSGLAPTTLMLFHSVAANNGIGRLRAWNGIFAAPARVALAIIRRLREHANGLRRGFVESYGDNYIDGNGNTKSTTTAQHRPEIAPAVSKSRGAAAVALRAAR